MGLNKSAKMKLFQDITNWSRDKMRLNEKAINAICEGGADNAITYDEQNLTEEQKAQARANIDAASNSTVEQLDKEINGSDNTVWVEAEPISTRYDMCIGVNANTYRASFIGATGYNILTYELEPGTKYRVSAAKPVSPNSNYSSTLYGVISSSSSINNMTNTIGPNDNEEGHIEREGTISSSNYIIVCGDGVNTPKLEILQEVHSEGIEERVANLENEVEKTENKVQSLDGNESNETKYPSTKAVYNGIHPTIVTTQPQNGFLPNIFYNLGELTGNITFTLATPSDVTIVNHYYWTFETGSTAPTITWPNGITWADGSAPTINSNKHYEISVLNNIGMFLEV